MATKRPAKELKDIQENPSPFYSASPIDPSNLFLWEATIHGPVGSVYEGGVFRLSIRFPPDYPFKPMRIKFLVQVYHPAINSNGSMCLDFCNSVSWSPVFTLSKVLIGLRESLGQLSPDEPMDSQIAHTLTTDRALFDKTAKEWTRLYASPDSPRADHIK